MAGDKVGIIRAIFRYLRYWNWKKARFIIEKADEQFTGSVQGISAAFDIQQDSMVKQYQELRDAISQVESVLENKKTRLEELNEEEEELLGKREGALSLAEKAQDEQNTEEYDRHAAAFERFQGRIDEIEAIQERLKTEIADSGSVMDRYMLQLSEMQSEIEKMPQNKAEAIADFVSAHKIIELNDRLQGLESSLDRGPISAVLKANQELTAKARISEKLAGTDVRLQDKQYEQAGRVSTSKSKLEDMLAARKAEKAAPEEKTENEKDADDRPKI